MGHDGSEGNLVHRVARYAETIKAAKGKCTMTRGAVLRVMKIPHVDWKPALERARRAGDRAYARYYAAFDLKPPRRKQWPFTHIDVADVTPESTDARAALAAIITALEPLKESDRVRAIMGAVGFCGIGA